MLISTHLIGDLERVAEFIGLMDRGRLVFSERLEELQRRYRRVQVVFPGAGVPPGYSVPGALREQAVGPVLTALVNLADDRQLDSLRAVPGVRLAVFPLNLEEVFIELLGRPDREEAPPAPEAEDPEYDNIIALK